MADQYPKWVTPHASHITTVKGGRQIAPLWTQSFVNPATGVLQVLVNNIGEENKAGAASAITVSVAIP